MKLATLLAVMSLAAAAAAHAQPTCPMTVDVQVDASLLPDGQGLTVGARWFADWEGTVSSARVDSAVTRPDGSRGELHPQLARAIQQAIVEQVRCEPRVEGPSPTQYTFMREVQVRPRR